MAYDNLPQEEKPKENQPEYNPTDQQKARIKFVYGERQDMADKRNLPYVQFNDRTLKEFIDDSEKRLNAYVPNKESQGKESWQSNFATRQYANKAKALLASTARDIPGMKFKAVNAEDQYDYFGADIIEKLTNHSYNQGNPQEDLFFLAWSNVGKGTVIDYEGFEKQLFVNKRIKSFDLLTGDVEEEEVERSSYGEPVSYEVPLMSLLIKNFYIRDIQEQPAIIQEIYYADKERFDAAFGKYPNAKYVKDCSVLKVGESDTYFHNQWKEAVASNKGYLVCKYMNKYKDIYRIVANGVELYNGPMLWVDITRKGMGKKMYPFAKSIYEPFATGEFFYGNSLPNSAMGEGDVLNTLYNSSLDKQYRSLVPPLLVGMVNKDMLDLEDEVVAGDTKIYVDDINQVKQMEMRGITDSDVKMINLISQGLDLTTLDPQQQGAAQKYVTARAAVSADESAKKLKGIFFMFMESLWLQKTRLRIPNILLSYTQPKMTEILGADGVKKMVETYRTFNVEKVELSDGQKGTLAIEFRNRGEIRENKQALQTGIEAQEINAAKDGQPFEKIILPYGFLDHLSFDCEVIPETLWQSSQSLAMAMTIEKITLVNKVFPEYFAANKEILFRDLLKNYGDDAGKYNLPKPMNFQEEQGLEMAKGMAGKASGAGGQGGQGGMISDITGNGSNGQNNELSQMVGQ